MARAARIEANTAPSDFVREVAATDRAAAVAHFVQEQTGSIFGVWVGRMSAADQRAMFGKVYGRGRLHVDGANEVVAMSVSMAFGTMRDFIVHENWKAFA